YQLGGGGPDVVVAVVAAVLYPAPDVERSTELAHAHRHLVRRPAICPVVEDALPARRSCSRRRRAPNPVPAMVVEGSGVEPPVEDAQLEDAGVGGISEAGLTGDLPLSAGGVTRAQHDGTADGVPRGALAGRRAPEPAVEDDERAEAGDVRVAEPRLADG